MRNNLLIVFGLILLIALCTNCAPKTTGTEEPDTAADTLSAADAELFRQYQNDGVAAAMRGDFNQALSNFQKAEAINPHDTELLGQTGSTLRHLKRYEEALPYFERILALQPGNHTAYANIGILRMSLEQYDKATEAFEKVLEIKPGEKLALVNLVDIAYKTDEYDRCRRYIARFKEVVAAEDPRAMTKWERLGVRRALARFNGYLAEMDEKRNVPQPSN